MNILYRRPRNPTITINRNYYGQTAGMPPDAYVKEEEVVPPMPPGAYFKEEDRSTDAVVKEGSGGWALGEGRQKRRRSK